MIHIDDTNIIGKGHHREVYRHPDNPNMCIKIVVDLEQNPHEEEKEKAYYRHLQKRNVSWEMLPRYHGDVPTNLGPGSVFDLITNTDGNVAKTLGHYLQSNELTNTHQQQLSLGLKNLKKYLLTQRILTQGLAHRNIVCQITHTAEFNLCVVDNIGNSEFIPLSQFFRFRAEKKINKKWQRFEVKLLTEFPDNKALQLIFTN
jgi:hypothetical protein